MNSLILSGHLTKEVILEPFTTKKGDSISRSKGTIAVNNGKEETIFIPFEIWGNKADKLKEYSTKGSRVNLQGLLKQFITDKGNNKRQYFTYMLVQTFEVTDTKEITESRKAQIDLENNPFSNTDKNSIYDNDDLPF